MLHLIFQAPTDVALIQRLDSGDDVVFLENAVFQVNKGSIFNNQLQYLLNNCIPLYVLKDEIESRGMIANELALGVEVIDYDGLVKLTEKNEVIRTWS